MKRDLTKKTTVATLRTLRIFNASLIELLAVKPFEDITVQELCEKSMVARATFYNYFYDKYDLLTYFWESMIDTSLSLNNQNDVTSFDQYMMNWINLLEKQHCALRKAMKNNSIHQQFLDELRVQLHKTILKALQEKGCPIQFPLPLELIATHYVNAIMSLIEWKYVKKNECSKAEMLEILRYLVGKKHLFPSVEQIHSYEYMPSTSKPF